MNSARVFLLAIVITLVTGCGKFETTEQLSQNETLGKSGLEEQIPLVTPEPEAGPAPIPIPTPVLTPTPSPAPLPVPTPTLPLPTGGFSVDSGILMGP